MTPIRATWSFFFGRQNDVLARITERSKDDYDNDVSDNCDHNFGTFDDFGVNNDQKVSNNMILMSKYKGKHGGKKGQKIRAGVSPHPFRAMPERKHFFSQEGFPKSREMAVVNNIGTIFTMFCTFLSFLVKCPTILPWSGL